jgi:hypothetical protein
LCAAATLPYWTIAAGSLPLLLRPPSFRFVAISAVMLFLGLGVGIYLGNVNVLIAGLILLAFAPGAVGGTALAFATGVKIYPLVLLPLLWHDRARLFTCIAVLAALCVTGTWLFGYREWARFAATLLHEGRHCDVTLNPFAFLGSVRTIPAVTIIALGLRWRSPTLTLAGATFLGGVVTRHYLPTFAAALAVESQGSFDRMAADLSWTATRIPSPRALPECEQKRESRSSRP